MKDYRECPKCGYKVLHEEINSARYDYDCPRCGQHKLREMGTPVVTVDNGDPIPKIITEAVALSLNMVAPKGIYHRKLSLYETLVMSGYTAETPTKTGMYYMVCNENDYEPELVKVFEHDLYGLVLTDDCVEGIPLESYDLTKLMWKRFSPGALL